MQRNFDNFLNIKIKNLSKATKENIVYSNRIFNEFLQEIYKKTTDEVIEEARQDKYPDEVIIEVLQDWVNSMSEKVSYRTLRTYCSGINKYMKYQKILLDLTDIEWPQNMQGKRDYDGKLM
ncbi:MAG: hypothetical protein OEM28_02535 [Nitrosopumilus sp.]|nr:hypothetical protein [Nitrosopumilus sp.]MDH3486985.1 hypothetical protein [Nitrosopumilus sp.]